MREEGREGGEGRQGHERGLKNELHNNIKKKQKFPR